MLRLRTSQRLLTAPFKRAYTTSNTQANEEGKPCTKFSPIKESAKTLRHLRFTVPFDYNEAHNIQTNFVSAFLDFKKMVSTIERSSKELASKGLESNDYEKKIIQQILENKPSPTILSFEFKPVFTAGQREKKRLTKEQIDTLKEKTNYDFVQTDRGGEITFHNPGQVVIYPIVDLRDFRKLTIKCFVSLLEDSVIEMLRKNGIKSEKTENTGVWIDQDTKISSVGLQVKRSVTFHGISLNVCNEIPKIEDYGLVFCGLPGKTQTTMKQLGSDISMSDASRQLVRQIASKLGVEKVETIELDSLELHTDAPGQH